MGEALMKFIATFSVNSMATVKLVPHKSSKYGGFMYLFPVFVLNTENFSQ